MDLSQIKEQLQNNNEKKLVWSNEWKKDQKVFLVRIILYH